jgi:hypothetical protein
VVVVVGVIDRQNSVGRQIQDVCRHLEFTFHPELDGLFSQPSQVPAVKVKRSRVF